MTPQELMIIITAELEAAVRSQPEAALHSPVDADRAEAWLDAAAHFVNGLSSRGVYFIPQAAYDRFVKLERAVMSKTPASA